eukprot:CAMPEP_0203752248 /NCGR_PEP_ID=MMETSP0098-20131031/6189_1 /ASSEMBLY_ACC=CAM_ASM_000208 /TAXON_ID=96639 /ORGANISM=" , Strain NY0313808BC1" /LENGTH=642 /DNA_ID=CAMNT_0050642323 /DNA_START=386 /DNA_END=2314 /DNA_ORIENTATION=+
MVNVMDPRSRYFELGAWYNWTRVWMRVSLSAPLIFMYFLMLMTNTLLRDTKDTLLVTSSVGVEAIPILKSWVVIPASFLFFLVYYRLSTLLESRSLFLVILAAFNGFFFLFGLILYPRQDDFIPTALVGALKNALPENARYVYLLLENWPLGLFYVISELWASAICSLMFWQVANSVVSVDYAKSIYPLVGAGGNVGMVIAGNLLRLFANRRDQIAAKAYLGLPSKTINAQGVALDAKPIGDDTTLDAGYSFFSRWLLALSGRKIDPVEVAWQGTLLGIAILTAVSTVLIVYCYDSVQYRALRYGEADIDAYVQGYKTPNGNVAKTSWEPNGDSVVLKMPDGPVKHRTASGGTGEFQDQLQNRLSPSSALKEKHRSCRDLGFNDRNNIPTVSRKESLGNAKKQKIKISLWEALRTLLRSTPLRCAAVLVISYGVSISLVEVSWKGQVKKALSKPNDYSRFMATFWTITGLVSMAFMLIGRVILHRVGYAPAVLFTPVTMAVAGSLFFIVSILQDLTGPTDDIDGDDIVPWAAYFGGCAVLFAKAAKYAFFDATKEIIFIPLDDNSKSIGKAAIDVVAYRLSKSGGSLILQLVIMFFGSISTSAGCVPISIVFGFVVVAWVYAAIGANKFMHRNSESASQHIV